MLCNLPIAIGASGVSSHYGSISPSVTCGNVRNRWGRWAALHLRNGQLVAVNFYLGLHPLHECLATQIDLLLQSLPNALSNTIRNKLLIALPGFLAHRIELTQ